MGKKVLNVAVFGLSGLIPGKAGKLVRSAILIGAGVASGNLQLVAAGVAMGASALKSTKGPKVGQSTLDRLSASIDPRTPRKGAFGHTALNVDVRDQEYTGTNNDFFHRFAVVASHKVTSIQEIWFDDKLAWTAAGGAQGEFAGYLTVATVLEGNAGNAINISARMGNTRRFTGCAYVHFQYKITGGDKKTDSPFAQSIPTRVTIIGEGMPVYDPRYDSTVPGGSGPARADDQTTWQYSYSGSDSGRNPACQTVTYLLGWRIQNPVTNAWKLAVGKGTPPERIDLPSFITAANLCDEPVTLAAGGTEPRYRSDGVFSELDQATDVLDNLKATMAGELDDMDGLIRLSVVHNDLAVPVLEITADDVMGDYVWTPFASLEANRNVIRGSYVDPSTKSLYQMVPYPDVAIDSPDGIERAEPVNYQFVQSGSQAQRLSKQRLARAQYAGTFVAEFKSRLWRAQKNDVVAFTFGPAKFIGKLFRILDMAVQVSGIVPVTLREEHPNIYLWEADERPTVQAVDSTPYTNFDLPVTQFLHTVSEGADVTAYNVAADFTGRGALATENFVYFDGGFIKEPVSGGGYADATTSAYRTNLGTAADFTGRGALATLNSVDMATTQVVGKTAANIAETTTLKWAGESGADITGGHTAADFTGRGALATKNVVTYGTGDVSGFGTLAGRNNARLANEVYRSDGVTVATEAALVTSLGTAADFTGRGALATLNAVTYGSSTATGFGTLAGRNTARLANEVYRSDGVTVATEAALVTSLGTAADFTGRGALATLNAVALDTQVTDGATYKRYATTEQTKLGGIATGATVGSQAGTNLYRTDGTTVMTQAEVRTVEGTAADFTGRGALATLNAVTYGTSTASGFGTLAARNTARLGTEVYRADGTTVTTDAMVVTSLGTAADFTGRGALATLNAVTYGTSTASGFGTLAARSTARLGTEVYRADGTTVTTDAMVVTSLGTAADFTGRGALATLNAVTYGTSTASGFGTLAARNTARLANEVYRSDGVTVATEAALVTSLGTAADFTGRGALATLNSVALDTQVTDGTTYKRYATTEQTKLTGVATGATVGAVASTNLYRSDGSTVMTQAEVRTAEGTAADFTGRGALATLNAVTYGTSTTSGFGTLAARSTARLGTEVYRADGTTVTTDAMLVTAIGTAADFTGRGALATLNAVALDTQVTDGTTYKRFATTERTKLTGVATGATADLALIALTADHVVEGATVTKVGASGWNLNGQVVSVERIVGFGVITLRAPATNVNINIGFDPSAAASAAPYGNLLGVAFYSTAAGGDGKVYLWNGNTVAFIGAGIAWAANDIIEIVYNKTSIFARINGVQIGGSANVITVTAGNTYYVKAGIYQQNGVLPPVSLIRTMTPWGANGGTGTPEDGADVTNTHTAADFTGRGALATLNAVDPTTSQFKATGSVPPTIPDNSFSYTSTSAAITITWPNMTLYRMDGTTIAITSGSVALSSLPASTTYKVYAYAVDGGGTTASISFVTGGSGSPTILFASSGSAAAAATMYARGNIPLGGFQVSTTASGSGGGGGGGASSCPHPATPFVTPCGTVRADNLTVGASILVPGGWGRIVSINRTSCRRWVAVRSSNAPEASVVTPTHVFYRGDGRPVRAENLRLGDVLRTDGDHVEVVGLAFVDDDAWAVMLELQEPHLYLIGPGRLLSHNPVGKP